MFLTKEELQELTGRTRRDAQVAALRSMGIEHARALLSHADMRTTELVYRRKPERVRPLNSTKSRL